MAAASASAPATRWPSISTARKVVNGSRPGLQLLKNSALPPGALRCNQLITAWLPDRRSP